MDLDKWPFGHGVLKVILKRNIFVMRSWARFVPSSFDLVEHNLMYEVLNRLTQHVICLYSGSKVATNLIQA